MWQKTPLIVVPPTTSTIELIGRLGGFDVVVVDVDGTLVPDRAAADTLSEAVERAGAAAAEAGVGRLVIVSNAGRHRGAAGDGVVWQVNKPWTRKRRLGISPLDAVAVVGDRLLPDGLLARRWGATFYLMSGPPGEEAGPGQPPGSYGPIPRLLFRITAAE